MDPFCRVSGDTGEISAALNEIKTVHKMSSSEKHDLILCEKKLEILEENIQKCWTHSAESISQMKTVSIALNRKECALIHENLRLRIATESCKKLEEDANQKALDMNNLKREYNALNQKRLQGNMAFARTWACTSEGMEMRRKLRINEIQELERSNAELDKKLGAFKKNEEDYCIASKTLEELKALRFKEVQQGLVTKDELSNDIECQKERVEVVRKCSENTKTCEDSKLEISKLKSRVNEIQCSVGRLKLLVSNWNAILSARSHSTLQRNSANTNANTHGPCSAVHYSTSVDQNEDGMKPPDSKYRLVAVTTAASTSTGRNGKPSVALRRAEPAKDPLRASQKFNFKKKQNSLELRKE